jgi:hypothetical protein
MSKTQRILSRQALIALPMGPYPDLQVGHNANCRSRQAQMPSKFVSTGVPKDPTNSCTEFETAGQTVGVSDCISGLPLQTPRAHHGALEMET